MSAYEWIREKAFTDLKNLGPRHIYRTLDHLIGRRERIEVGIFKELERRLDLKVDLLFYDLTGSYFEGEGPELAKCGESKDDKPDKKQLVLTLVLIDGIPIANEVLKIPPTGRP